MSTVKKPFNVRLTRPFYDALFRLAALMDCPMTVVIRKLIKDEALRLNVWGKDEEA